MKTCAIAFLVAVGSAAAAPTLPSFSDTIESGPPLSLAEAAKSGALKQPKGGQDFAAAFRNARPRRAPEAQSHMPIVTPRADVDRHMPIVRPDPSIDPRMIIRIPGGKSARQLGGH